MDYMIELANHSDILEAIEREPNAESAPSLLKLKFLRHEHPHVWIAELVHAFYANPALAARAWKNLRYCRSFRGILADHVVTMLTSTWRESLEQKWWWKWATPLKELRALIPEQQVGLYMTDRSAATHACSDELRRQSELVDQLCLKTGKYPDPPGFLPELMVAHGVAVNERDKTTEDLLRDPAKVTDWARETRIAVPFSMALDREVCQIHATRRETERLTDVESAAVNVPGQWPGRKAIDANLLGLAFSGGGIRSATFNLGVLQSLANIGLLRHCDYLSTVSGGGYIGSWFSAWLYRESLRQKSENLAADDTSGAAIAELQRRLSPMRSPNPIDERVKPIRFLREYSNYLTPRTGFFSADTWTMIGIYVRNALLNQVIIVSLVAAVLLLPRDWFAVMEYVDRTWWPAVLSAVLWLVGATILCLNLRHLNPRGSETTPGSGTLLSAGRKAVPPAYAQPLAIQVGVVLPWLVTSALAAHRYAESTVVGDWNVARACALVGAVVAITLGGVMALGRADRCWKDERAGRAIGAAAFAMGLATIAAGAVASGLTWVLLRLLQLGAPVGSWEVLWHATGLGAAGLMSVLSLAIVVQLGMLGEKFPDEHREWWSRLRAYLHIAALVWLAWFVVAIYVPWGIHWFWDNHGKVLTGGGLTAAVAWVASTIFGVMKGQTAEDDLKRQHEAAGAASTSSATALRWATLGAPYIFIVGLVVAIAGSIDALYLLNDSVTRSSYWDYVGWTANRWTGLATAASVSVGLLFSWRINVNEFSMHHFYKNRLVRCYLGASRTEDRKPDWFTGFDPNDDIRLAVFDHDSKATKKAGVNYPGPYPILNCALNLVGGEDLAWQERKAESFVLTPKYCGYDLDRAVLTKTNHVRRSEAFAPTESYFRDGDGPLLGMAMAISGAAANPNMGRATSPASAFLMTVFNARLGSWLGNPRHEEGCGLPGPTWGLPYTALELFGGTNDKRKFINVSDGGHFDNLGVYELIRRNCRYIIACDAGQDGGFTFEDLGDLIRRCRTDFGVEIDIDVDRIRVQTAGISQSHCVVGKIHYLHIPRRDARGRLLNDDEGALRPCDRPAHEEGYLIYIKPSLTGDEPQDVLEYARRIPEFPHQTTADQWFSESQFESYRRLGMHIAEQAFSRYSSDDTQGLGSVTQLFERLYKYWYPPSVAVGQHSTGHAESYSRVMELVRTQTGLHRLDHTMFEALPELEQAINPRDEFYVCNALIQLMEGVYADLDLEQNWNHPHVEGWMRVFKRWAQQDAFRRTWKISESTYAERFGNFYNDRLRGRALGLRRGFVAAHRGRVKAGDAVENTLAAFERALDAGAMVIELDVRRLGSGQLVVHHDDEVDGRAIVASSYTELRKLRDDLLLLTDCLERLQGRIQLDLELKVPGIEAEVLNALRDLEWEVRDYVLTSSHRSVPPAVRRICTDARVGLLVSGDRDYNDSLEKFLELGVDFLAPDCSVLRNARRERGARPAPLWPGLDRAARACVPLVPWVVNDRESLRALLGHDAVAGVITDDVELALRVKNEL